MPIGFQCVTKEMNNRLTSDMENTYTELNAQEEIAKWSKITRKNMN